MACRRRHIDEIYVSSSLGLGGSGSGSSATRDVFAGSEAAGSVHRFSDDGSHNRYLHQD